MKTIVVPQEITEMCIIPIKRSKVGHLLLVALSDGTYDVHYLVTCFSVFSLKQYFIILIFNIILI